MEKRMVSETARVRELHRYYQPWLELQRSSSSSYGAQNSTALRNSSDRALTSFAQLAALKLNVKRAVVCLLDTDTQYTLTEVTQSISLQDDERHIIDGQRWVGVRSAPRSEGVCEQVLSSTYTVADEPSTDGPSTDVLTADAFVCSDLSIHPKLKHRREVESGIIRFYAGVPIRTFDGIDIGVYSVSDDKPRTDLDAIELRSLQDVAATVFEHLSLAKARNDHARGHRLIRGLADFIEGHPHDRPDAIDNNEIVAARLKADYQDKRSTPSRRPDADAHETRETWAPSNSRNPRSAAASSTRPNQPSSEIPEVPRAEGKPHEIPQAMPSSQSVTKKLLSRASRTLLDCMDTDGIIFFDASAASFGDKPSNSVDGGRRTSGAGLGPDAPGSRVSNLESGQSHSEEESGSASEDAVTHHQQEGWRPADVLASAVRDRASDTMPYPPEAFKFRTKALKRYIRKYPAGTIFHFDDSGACSSGDDTVSDDAISIARSSNSRDGRKFVVNDFTKVLPDVRSAVFMPLWNYGSERWYAVGLMWSTRAERVMNPEEDLLYIKAFGANIMCEISRLEALTTDQAKTTFIASISHELRSPLHGILGSIEFFKDSKLDGFQSGLLASIATCGKTLLDTIDHVLDFSKINNLVRPSSKRRANNALAPRAHMAKGSGLVVDLDMAELVEEVCDAISAGQTFKKANHDYWDGSSAPATRENRPDGQSGRLTSEKKIMEGREAGSHVDLILSIAKRDSWKVTSEPGALRRIVMNVLGNAFKYTSSGSIEVSLQPPKDDKKRTKELGIQLKVIDSGIGISQEYLKDRLYTPFSQQDPFATGTGLGLSIVRHLVQLLGGKIDVSSRQGFGTEVTMSLALPIPKDSKPLEEENADETSTGKSFARDALYIREKELRLCLLDPLKKPGNKSKGQRSLSRLESSILETCRDWLGIETLTASAMDGVTADVFLVAEPPPVEEILSHYGCTMASPLSSPWLKESPLLVVCTNAAEASALKSISSEMDSSLDRTVQVISQPIGPMKLATSLRQCLENDSRSTQRGANFEPWPLQRQTTNSQTRSLGSTFGGSFELDLQKQNLKRSNDVGKSLQTKAEQPAERPSYVLEANARRTATLNAQAEPGHSQAVENTKQHAAVSEHAPVSHDTTMPEAIAEGNSSFPRILIVDDNSINLRLLSTFVSKSKLPFKEATNGLEAFNLYKSESSGTRDKGAPVVGGAEDERASSNGAATETIKSFPPPFDFILMDISMPVMDGLTATREIRKFEKEMAIHPPATIVALTGLGSDSAQDDAYSSGIDVFCRKPVKFKELRSIFDATASSPRESS